MQSYRPLFSSQHHHQNLMYSMLRVEIGRRFCCIPSAMLVAAHAKLLGAGFHAAAHHQPIARLKHMQWTGHSRVGHGADKYRDVLSETRRKRKDHNCKDNGLFCDKTIY